jgi:hypothetical protein
MKKKILATVAAAGTALALTASLAGAHAPTVSITSPSANQLIETATFPKTVTVAGSIEHMDNATPNPNLCKVSAFKVEITDGVDTGEVGSKNWTSANSTCPTSDSWSFDYDILEPGEYTFIVSGRHGGGDGNLGTDEVDFEVRQSVIVSFPAAPSVAAKILADADVPARYGSGKSGGNHIADVAAEMNKTKGTDFQGVAKKDVADYANQVREFLTEKGALA